MYAAAMLANFFESGWAIQVLVGDLDRTQYFASRLTRHEIQRHLRIMADTAAALPAEVRQQMPAVDWQAWIALDAVLPGVSAAHRDAVWQAITGLIPVTGQHMRQYRASRPDLFRFRMS